jgi:hypothetical protein
VNYTDVELVCCVYRTQCTLTVHRIVHNNSPRTVRKDTVRKIDGLRKIWSATYRSILEEDSMLEYILLEESFLGYLTGEELLLKYILDEESPVECFREKNPR